MTAKRDTRYCRCGTRLANDNAGTRCGACEQAQGLLRGPPRLPAEFWSTEAFQDAFAARHMGRVLVTYRRHPSHGHVISQARLAGWLQTSQPQISRAENGPPIQNLATLEHWARTLRIPQQHLWFSLKTAAEQSEVTPASGLPHRTQSPSWKSAVPEPRVDLSAIHATAQAFRAADRQAGGGHLYRTVQHYVQAQVGPQLTGLTSRRDSAAVFSAAASLTEMLGWMAHDSGSDMVAADHFLQALRLAAAGEDLILQANILASMAHLAGSLGRGTEVVGHAHAGLQLLARSGCHTVLARLHAMQARGLAACGNSTACGAALRRAEEALCRQVDEAYPWASPFDEGSLASEAATCMHALGQLNEAARQAGRVVHLRDNYRARSRALGQLTLAAVSVDQGEIDAAAELGIAVVAGVRGVESAQVRNRLAHLASALAPHQRCTSTQRFLAALRAMHTAPLWSSTAPPTAPSRN